MNTVTNIVRQARALGLDCSERTFWKYHQLRLLPRGQKIRGRGNAVYFPDETVLRLWIIHFLTQQLEFTLSEVSRYPWYQFECPNAAPTFQISPEFIVTAKHQFDKARDAALHKLVGELLTHLTSETEKAKRT
jgi:DNA-binding transcriptional MerR regulator